MLGALLQERFKLKTHEDTKEQQVYRLVLANSAPNLQKAESETGISGRSTKTAEQVSARTTLVSFAKYLSERLDRPVVDQTGLIGVYSIHLEWMPDTAAATGVDVAGSSIFTALQEQLGLRLVAGKAAVALVVVDSIKNIRPITNARLTRCPWVIGGPDRSSDGLCSGVRCSRSYPNFTGRCIPGGRGSGCAGAGLASGITAGCVIT